MAKTEKVKMCRPCAEQLKEEGKLILPIKKKWFDMIASGEKKEEYREDKPYWTSRFKANDFIYDDDTDERPHRLKFVSITRNVIFKNGYGKDAPQLKCLVKIHKGYGKEEWGAEPNKLYYVLDILKILE